MELEGLHQAPFCCTMMGALRGALTYYGVAATDALLYGASGHAFVLNIHKELCPSGPYVWDSDKIEPLIAHLGVRREFLGFYHPGSSAEERAALEERLREHLNQGRPCMLLNMENQLILGYDSDGFVVAQPCPIGDFPPGRLTYGTWSELGEEIHICFYALHRCEPADLRTSIVDSLRYAVSLWRDPKSHTSEDYGMGPDAYRNWSSAVAAGHGGHHGNWWNAMVWSECRARAAEYFTEIASELPSPEDAAALRQGYAKIAQLLSQCADKDLNEATKLELLTEAAAEEKACIARIERVLGAID